MGGCVPVSEGVSLSECHSACQCFCLSICLSAPPPPPHPSSRNQLFSVCVNMAADRRVSLGWDRLKFGQGDQGEQTASPPIDCQGGDEIGR